MLLGMLGSAVEPGHALALLDNAVAMQTEAVVPAVVP